jgi:hypothetical protein
MVVKILRRRFFDARRTEKRRARVVVVYHAPLRLPVYQEVSEVERRLSELQSQIDRLTLSLHLWREKPEQLQPLERQLSQLAQRGAEIVDRWDSTGERYAQAVTEIEQRLADWDTAEARASESASSRIRELQRLIETEWAALRQIHEEPVKQLREQANNLAEVSMAAAASALGGFERAEARLSGLESDLHRRLNELSSQVQAAVAEVRGSQSRALASQAPSWPLEGVVRLHNQLRRAGDPTDAAPEHSMTAERRLALPEPSTELSERIETLQRDLTERQTEIKQEAERSHRSFRFWRAAILLLMVGGGAAAGIVIARLQQQMGIAQARVVEAETQAQAAVQAADQRIAATRDEAERQIAAARETAVKAQVISDVLASPDLVRYNLAGGDGTTLYRGQVSWSRSRGLIFSGSRLPPPPPNSVYQIWLLTTADPISAGLFVPDAAGRFTLATDTPPPAPRPVVGVSVTIEPAGGQARPQGPALLARAE